MNAELLLADRSACLRLLALRGLLGKPSSDPEVKELLSMRGQDPIAATLLSAQEKDGSWPGVEPAGTVGRNSARSIATSMALSRLAFLGFAASHPAVRKAAAFLFSRQQADGSWPLPARVDGGGYSMIPLQTSLPLEGLARAGFAEDPRAERAYQWLLDKRLDDGAWPTGIAGGVEPRPAAGVRGFVGGYRRLPHSRWGCRSNTTAALICLAHHPSRRFSVEARAALDHLVARETRDRANLGFETARTLGFETPRGFLTFHAAFDPALVLDLCARMGASADDERIAELIRFVRSCAGPAGLWEYPSDLLATRWVSFGILSSLAALEAQSASPAAWTGLQPKTPFRAYPRPKPRY